MELIDTLAILSEIPVKAIKDLVRQASDEGLIVLGKACGIGWPDLQKVLAVALPSKTKTPERAQRAVCELLDAVARQRATRRPLHSNERIEVRGRASES